MHTDEGPDLQLKDEEKKLLLRIARDTITARAGGGRSALPDDVAGVLRQECGGFVTLHAEGNLRGCIGYVQAFKPLVETVADMAAAAAFEDPRFPAVTAAEVPGIEIEISVLSPLRKTDDPGRITVGTHGILISKGHASGLLLPQVAVEYGWDRETFLDQTCVKAGLPPGSWRDEEAEVKIFSAIIFNEKDYDA